MLSYRHAFHAGNHADVLKHFVLLQLLRHLLKKEKPITYVDTHAGAGAYSLKSAYASKNAEYETGIGRLWQQEDLPEPLADYVAQIREFNPNGGLEYYPGSPLLAAHVTRPVDKLHLHELHPADYELLQQNIENDRRIQIHKSDGLAGLKALLPPPSRRAMTLIDPPYENKQEYHRVVDALQQGLKRFATGVYAVWYPMLQRLESQKLSEQLKSLPMNAWVNVTLTIDAPAKDGFGMHGSGMFVINPPWTLLQALEQTMPYLVKHLGQSTSATFGLEHHLP